VLDYWAHAFLDDPNLRKEHVTDDYDELLSAMEAEMMAMGDPQEMLAKAASEDPGEEPPPAPSTAQAGGVKVTQEVVSLGEDDVPNDWEDVVSDRYGRTGGLS
jgi:hypothetical protein